MHVSPTISEKGQKMMEMLMMEPKVMEKVANGYEYKIISIYNNGTVVLGKTSYKWWNDFIKCHKVLSFQDFVLAVWQALLELSEGETRRAILKGLSLEILEKSVRDNKYDETIDRLIDVVRHACNKNELRSIATPSSSEDDRSYLPAGSDKDIKVSVNKMVKTLHAVDCIGDPLLDIDIIIEPTSFNVRRVRS